MEQPDKQRGLRDALSKCETKPQVCVCVRVCEPAYVSVQSVKWD